jgi:hypothetical protein
VADACSWSASCPRPATPVLLPAGPLS